MYRLIIDILLYQSIMWRDRLFSIIKFQGMHWIEYLIHLKKEIELPNGFLFKYSCFEHAFRKWTFQTKPKTQIIDTIRTGSNVKHVDQENRMIWSPRWAPKYRIVTLPSTVTYNRVFVSQWIVFKYFLPIYSLQKFIHFFSHFFRHLGYVDTISGSPGL